MTKQSLPKGWRWEKLGDICEINPRRPAIERTDSTLTTFVQMSAVDDLLGVIARPEQRPFSEIKKGYTFFAENDVIFAKITPCMENGKHAIANNLIDGFGFGSTEFHVIRPKEQIIPEWVWFYVRQPSILQEAKNYFTGAVGQQRVPDSFLKSLEIPIPSLEEQKRIAARLDEQMRHIEQARLAAEESLSVAWELQSKYLKQSFLGITPLSTGTTRDKAPKGWRWEKLTSIARLESGHTPSRYHAEWWGGDIPWIALPDIRLLDGKTAYETIEYTNELGIANSSARILPKGTVALSRTASVGFVTVMGREMATSQDFVNWVCGSELDPYFLMYLLIASRDYFRSISSGAIHKTVYMPTLKSLEVCIPPIEEQNRIAAYLRDKISTSEALAESLESQLAEIESLPSAVLGQAFAGQL